MKTRRKVRYCPFCAEIRMNGSNKNYYCPTCNTKFRVTWEAGVNETEID